MEWYRVLSPDIEKWVALAIFVAAFAIILYRKINVAYVATVSALVLIVLGIMSPSEAVTSVNWDVLALYWGYGMLAIAFRESKVPAWISNQALSRTTKEKYALLFLCALAMVLSSFMANPVVVIMLAPLAIEMAEKLKSSLFLYLVALAISSNVVTTVSMIADPPALILAATTGMSFLDFYWFQGRVGLGTLSVVGIGIALLTLSIQFRHLNKKVDIGREEIRVSYSPLALLILSVLALAFIPWNNLAGWNHPGLIGLILGIASLFASRYDVRDMFREFDWLSLLFLAGIFVLIAALNSTGLLRDLSTWLGNSRLDSPAIYLAIFVWVSVLLSSFIDNVPYTVLMIPVCADIAQALGVSPFPFYFGMLVGTGIGGNITPVGATANVLACGMLEKRGYKVELGKYLRIALPFSVSAVLAVHILLQLIWL